MPNPDESKPPIVPPPQPLGYQRPDTIQQEKNLGPVNLSLKDNLLQLCACVLGALLGAVAGNIVPLVSNRGLSGTIGGFLGLLAGLFGSGLYLMIERWIRYKRYRNQGK